MDRKVCGIYYYALPPSHPSYHSQQPSYLPLLSLTTDITLTPTFSRTTLRQHFKNPSTETDISEANYTFPLHPTQTITSFTCHIGTDKTLNGIVQSKPKAKATYDAAIARGETAGLLSWSASDVWQTKLGNIPAGESVEVVITCVAQLQHDSEKDAIRFNLPTHIAPRYGAPPRDYTPGATASYKLDTKGWGWWRIWRRTGTWDVIEGGMKVNVFIEMDCPVKMVESPSHSTNLRLGTNAVGDGDYDFDPRKAVLTLSADDTALDKDFVVLVKTARSGHPVAVLQRHPTRKDTAGMMLTLVPKFNLPISRPEVVFIVDRSGSMCSNEVQLRKALAVFLQSLPVGVKFNICSFGSSHSFLWKKSKAYTEETLKEAQEHVSRFSADMGGTEMYPPIKAAIERRYKDLNLELLLLTDGDIWQRDQLINYLKDQCKAKTIRMFTLGIGNGISHALIDGLAAVGGGYAQVVQLDEKLDSKVVRMLRAALGQHVSDYKLDFPDATGNDEDDYDMLDDTETLRGDGDSIKEKSAEPEPKSVEEPKKKKKFSLFDTSADLDTPMKGTSDDSDASRWSHLPPLPKLPAKIQSPHVVPPLFPFSRTNVYVVFDPVPKVLPKKALLHAKTTSGDELELEIPILRVGDGKDVLQLAARSFLQELEDGKGYLHENTLKDQKITKDKQESKWDEIIEREGVRWGEGFGVASKWTSFVAIEDKKGKETDEEKEGEAVTAPQEIEEESYEGGVQYARRSIRKFSAAPVTRGGGGAFFSRSRSAANPQPEMTFGAVDDCVFASLSETDEEGKFLNNFDFDSFLNVESDGVDLSFDFSAASPGYSAASPGYTPTSPFGDATMTGYSPVSPSYSPVSPTYSALSAPVDGSGVPLSHLDDYQAALMLLESSNKKRLMMARHVNFDPVSDQASPMAAKRQRIVAGPQDTSSDPLRQKNLARGITPAAAETASYGGFGAAQAYAAAPMMAMPQTMALSSAAPPPPPPPPGGMPVASSFYSAAAPAPAPARNYARKSSMEEASAAFDKDGEIESAEEDEADGFIEDRGVSIQELKKSSSPTASNPAYDQIQLGQAVVESAVAKSKKKGGLSFGGLFSRSSKSTASSDSSSGVLRSSYGGAPEKEKKESAKPKVQVNVGTADQRIHSLIMLQAFAGSWSLTAELATVLAASFSGAGDALGKLRALASKLGVSEDVVATWAAILCFEKGKEHQEERDTWELVVEKAVMWLDGEGKNDEAVKKEVAGLLGA